MSRIYISAAHKSSGKTTLSIGLCRALVQQGLVVQPFKKGPDYIDPLWLAKASGLTYPAGCYNLDFNTMGDDEILGNLITNSRHADISIIEGNKGLYDGVALDGSDSNAAMAKLTKSPVILVIDSRGITRGVAPLLMGYQCFDKDINIAGVIFNLCSGQRHEAKLLAVTQEYTDIPVLGVLRKNPLMALDERHLGLMPSNEYTGAEKKINEIASIVAEQVDLQAIQKIAKFAAPLTISASTLEVSTPVSAVPTVSSHDSLQTKKVRIGICEDAAFGFYYVGDKTALEEAGAELVSINTLEDEVLPEIDGLFIGGGFPEVYMQQLADNTLMRDQIKKAIEAGLPTYAECGGLMYLSQSIHWKGKSSPMVGIIPGDAIMYTKPQGRGHVELVETINMPWSNEKPNEKQDQQETIENENTTLPISPKVINAHEFHYSRLENAKNLEKKGKFAYKVVRGVGITGNQDGWVYKNLLASYAHMRDTDNFQWARRFVAFCRVNRDKPSN